MNIDYTTSTTVEIGKKVLQRESEAISSLVKLLDEKFAQCVQLMLHAKGRIIVTGMGKSGHIARKVASTLTSTGTPAYFIHPAEASHGDMGIISSGDILIVFSKSGETVELSHMIQYVVCNNVSMIAITENSNSTLGQKATLCITLPSIPEACEISLTPTTSAIMSLALGDALAIALLNLRKLKKEDFAKNHPGGTLGKVLTLSPKN